MSEDLKDIRTPCAVMFREISVKLETIRGNDLVHIHDDIKDIRTWVRNGIVIVSTAVAGVLAKVLFF